MAMKKPSMGRQKIKIEKIQVKNHLQVTFSKRRSGVFKKASELGTLCGVKVAVVVFSPAGKIFSFGHPNVDSIVDPFLTRGGQVHNPSDLSQLVEAKRNANFNMQLSRYLSELEMQRKRGEGFDETRKLNQRHCRWMAPVEQLGREELELVKGKMEELSVNVSRYGTGMMANVGPPVYESNGVLDRYEGKPVGANMVASGNGNFGYYYGFF